MAIFEEEPEECEEFDQYWIFTFADLVTLLLAFFVLLYSFCKPDLEQFKSVSESFKPTPPGTPFFLEGRPEILEALAKRVETSELSEEVFVTIDERGLVVTFKETLLFEPGATALNAKAKQAIEIFAAFLHALPNQVVIEGHTDDRPIRNSRFPSNWELSAARAGAVARFLEADGVAGRRMQVVGFGGTRPRFRNISTHQRALNRRVDVVVKPEEALPATSS